MAIVRIRGGQALVLTYCLSLLVWGCRVVGRPELEDVRFLEAAGFHISLRDPFAGRPVDLFTLVGSPMFENGLAPSGDTLAYVTLGPAGVHRESLRIVEFDLRTRLTRNLGPGSHVTPMRGTDTLVFFDGWPGPDGRVALRCGKRSNLATADTIGEASTPKGPGGWWHRLSAPVETSSGRFVTQGFDTALWIVDVRTGSRRSLGHSGLLPCFWVSTLGEVICQNGQGLTFAVDAVNGSIRRVRALDGMSGYAHSQARAATAVQLSGWPLFVVDSEVLKLYEWRTGRLRTISVGHCFSGSAAWLEGSVVR